MTSGTGTCTVHYNQAGNANYNAAPEVTETSPPRRPTRRSRSPRTRRRRAVYNTSFTVAATASSGLAVAITSDAGVLQRASAPRSR